MATLGRGYTTETKVIMKKVEITSDAYLACLIHAMSTEREEVMGLLLGEVSEISPLPYKQTVHFDPALVL